MHSICVVPTNRPESLRQWLQAWQTKGGWDELIVIEDAPERSAEVRELVAAETKHPYSGLYYSHAEIAAVLGPDAWIISRQDSACRCFGFLVAWWLGADAVLTLDDDCLPHPGHEDVVLRHQRARLTHPRWVSTMPEMRVRGLPYDDVGILPMVVASVGLWSGMPDLDARTQLALQNEGVPGTFRLPLGSRVIPRGQYVPVSGMNLNICREALPLFYFPLMGQGQPYRRFDDVWAGVIAKRILDHLGWHLSVGEPFVRHERASDPRVNLEKERPGMRANETFWRCIDAAPITGRTPLECLSSLAAHLQGNPDPYIDQLGRALWVWVRLFIERPRGL